LVVTRITDRDGNVVYEQQPHQRQILSEETAFIMAHMMEGVVQRGTATVVKPLGRPVAGKTGTTSGQMDAWFLGYTPEWVAGIWIGFDKKRMIGPQETGGRVSAPIFLRFMQEFLKDVPPIDFDPPDGVVPVAINVTTGRPVPSDSQGAFIEYYKTGTEPSSADAGEAPEIPKDYLSSDEF
jgi:penicillin-binding protein 1A